MRWMCLGTMRLAATTVLRFCFATTTFATFLVTQLEEPVLQRSARGAGLAAVVIEKKNQIHSSWFKSRRIDTKERCDQVLRQGTRTDVSRACNDLGLIHTQTCELDRERRLVPLVISQTRHAQDLRHHALKLIVELHKSFLKQTRGQVRRRWLILL